ncbi:Cholera toxin secretion protein epsF,type IV pilin biogenesis protein,type II secretion system protein F,Bacterial type II secretion system protein F domain [Chlamydia serpentis]|uniref:Cholera toxin secretion protein epsF,type IV pilin biogenesis protein,type II secretion system protein F,Bacterial type II secretion system protein F domain n=1 Tax=Chlamydia serpentis TaxID=1967782 RepID=A0A2R8FBW3_9CHLA|nr:type II secretion system F family protein [Chlamydia serpentis]SPN73929.1 Cholera toxin secretion protein epsF,type IV pilin biogenesis protein,type II secretion system protein F,Bacterial type II secretion system protein F domain [Chlamydia serpentis]
MPRYRYAYLDSNERKKHSYVEALHIQEAREKLIQDNVQVLGIREVALRRISVKSSELIIFTKQLLLLLRSGLPLYESLASLRDQYHGQKIGLLLTSFMEVLRSGGALSQAMAAHPNIFNHFYCSGVAAGESVGNLEGCLQNIIVVLEERAQISKKLAGALSYPIVLLVFSSAVMLFFLIGVIPSLKETFENMEVKGLTKIVFGISDYLCEYGYLFLGVLGFVTTIGIIMRHRIPWRQILEKLLFGLPGTKKFIVKVALNRFCSVASAILKGGGSLIEGLDLGCDAVPYERLKSDMKEIVQAVIGGGTLSQELTQRTWVPKLAIGMIALGEESGDLADVLGYVAHIYNEDTQKTLTSITSWCQPVILIFLGGIIGVIMLAILIPLTSNIQTL